MRTTFKFLFIPILFSSLSIAQVANHIVISEVFYLGSITNATEFVELYNPTASDIVLNGISL